MRDVQADILQFWFEEARPEEWFQKNDAFDQKIISRFSADFDKAMLGEYDAWVDTAHGALALIILLDQFSRNMFRSTAKAFSGDSKALEIAIHAVGAGLDQEIDPVQRRFMYLPFEHSEEMADQRRSVALFETLKDNDPIGYEYAVKHLGVIERFGRFPHRNKALGRENTAAETEYLLQPGAGF